MEHSHASIEIWFMMTQWELNRSSGRHVIINICVWKQRRNTLCIDETSVLHMNIPRSKINQPKQARYT